MNIVQVVMDCTTCKKPTSTACFVDQTYNTMCLNCGLMNLQDKAKLAKFIPELALTSDNIVTELWDFLKLLARGYVFQHCESCRRLQTVNYHSAQVSAMRYRFDVVENQLELPHPPLIFFTSATCSYCNTNYRTANYSIDMKVIKRAK